MLSSQLIARSGKLIKMFEAPTWRLDRLCEVAGNVLSKDLSHALALQDDLLELSTKLSCLIASAPSTRDAEAIRNGWQSIDRRRSKLKTLFRRLRKYDRRPREQHDRQSYQAQRRITVETRQLRQRLGLWDSMALLVERHIDPPSIGLLAGRPKNASDPLLSMIYTAFHRLANPNAQTESAQDHGCFADIAMNIQFFETLMFAAYRLMLLQGRTQKLRFLDVGCGGGSKVFAASRFFQYCDGLEYDPRYAEAGQATLRMIDAQHCNIYQCDALTFDGYDKYDVIYFYRPMRDDEILAQLEHRIFEQAAPCTVVLAPYHADLGPRSGNNHPCVDRSAFIAGKSQAEANVLRQEAEHTGTEIVTRSRDFPFDTGFWAPLLEAAQFNGFRA